MKRPPKASATPSTAAPDLAALARWFGADRWARLERQAAIFRAWNAETFRSTAEAFLQIACKTHASDAPRALHSAAMSLLIALGSAPTPEDRARLK